jgi:hypothetical protein
MEASHLHPATFASDFARIVRELDYATSFMKMSKRPVSSDFEHPFSFLTYTQK